MRLHLYSIRDRKASVYLAPFVSRSETDALRQISASLRDSQIADTPIGQHPEDFTLTRVGSFDDETGQIEPLTSPYVVCSLDELRVSRP